MSKFQEEIKSKSYYMVICMTILAGLLACFFLATAGVKVEDLEGYVVDFNSPGHEKEIEIVYQYYINNPLEDTEFLTRESIGVDLYDIDNDGKKEILYRITNPPAVYCGNRGCTFDILKDSGKVDQQGNPIYVPIRWNDPKEYQTRSLVLMRLKILKSTTLGMHDLLLDTDVIWKWQGNYYDRYKNIDEL